MNNIKEAIFEFEDANGMIQYYPGKNKQDAKKSFRKSFPKSEIINIKLHQIISYKSMF